MTPPQEPDQGPSAKASEAPAAVSLCPKAAAPEILRQRADFLRTAQGRRQPAGAFLLQARERGDGADGAMRVGFTASKKVGNAVTRNRAKRRLRALAREILPRLGRPGWDYVLVARPGATVERPFATLRADLEAALRQIHQGKERRAS